MPIRTGNSSSRCAATAASTARLGELNGAHNPAPGCLNRTPSCDLIAERNTSSWAARAARIKSASVSHRPVEPSTSVNRNVTTPEGAAPVMASPPPKPYVLQSQAISPCRGSDPDIRDSVHHIGEQGRGLLVLRTDRIGDGYSATGC